MAAPLAAVRSPPPLRLPPPPPPPLSAPPPLGRRRGHGRQLGAGVPTQGALQLAGSPPLFSSARGSSVLSSGLPQEGEPSGLPLANILAGLASGASLAAVRAERRRRRRRLAVCCEAAAAAAAGASAVASSVPAPGPPGRPRRRVRPGNLSPVREVPPGIAKPHYCKFSGLKLGPVDGLPWHPYMETIEIKQPDKIQAMREAGALAREALEMAGRMVVPGVTTDDIDAAVHDFIVARGAYPSPLGYAGFPKSSSTSVNDIIAHGIPDDRPLEDGDILNIDLTVFLGGCHGDTSSMFFAGLPAPGDLELCRCTHRAMSAGIAACGPGADFREIGRRIQAVADEAGYHVCDIFLGHGIGSYFHGAPEVFPYANDVDQGVMRPGMTFTVEPILVEDDDDDYLQWEDGWTIQSGTTARSAQFEHTLLITEDGHELLTGPSVDFEGIAAASAAAPARR